MSEETENMLIATCGECAYCNDTGPDPQNVSQRIMNCHVKPPLAVPMGAGGGGIAVMSIRPTVKAEDISCKKFYPKVTAS